VNVEHLIAISHTIDLGCHEGYLGHHTYNALLEKNLSQQRSCIEYSEYPLCSPQLLIAEGSANYGIELAFFTPYRRCHEVIIRVITDSQSKSTCERGQNWHWISI